MFYNHKSKPEVGLGQYRSLLKIKGIKPQGKPAFVGRQACLP
tara:strand:+ start:97 stop:222 length:126 start_codon:yes stop_codon:yes gene_type:complete